MKMGVGGLSAEVDRFLDQILSDLAHDDDSTDPDLTPLRQQIDAIDRELVELTATVAGYNLVSRFLVAMQIDQERRSP